MNTELQNKVWSILPKEFRKEVKKMYESTQLTGLQPFEDVERADRYAEAMCAIFGEDNLTSDAEGEEILTCEKSRAMQLYSHLLDLVENKLTSEHYSEWCDLEREYIALFGENVFADYFGSKCLSDEDAHEDNFVKSEPKFKIGDKVRVKFNAKELHSNPDPSKKIYYWQTARDKYLGKIFKITDIWKSGTITLNTAEIMFWEPFDLEPYTEPEENQNPSDSTKLKPQDVDKHFDNILKDSFREHNRLHIAAMMVPSVIATVPCSENEKGYAKMVATRSRILADALISECNKGVSK